MAWNSRTKYSQHSLTIGVIAPSGYDEREAKWSERNKHRENCYQTALDFLRGAWLNAHPEPEGTVSLFPQDSLDASGYPPMDPDPPKG